MTGRGNVALTSCLSVFAGACSLLADSEIAQCASNADCEGIAGEDYRCERRVCVREENTAPNEADAAMAMPDAGGSELELPERWSCLTAPPMAVPQLGRTVNVRFTVVNFIGFEVPADVSAKACRLADVMCSDPLSDSVVPDERGFLEFDVPHGFSGYFEITAPAILDSLLYSNRPYYEDVEFEAPAVVSPAISQALAEGGGETVDTNQGIVIIDVFDCDGEPAPGVVFSQEGSASDEQPFYFEGMLPDRDRSSTTTTTMATRSMAPRAFGGYSMAEVGYLTVIGTVEDTEILIGRATVSVRPNTMTFALMHAGYGGI